METKIFSSVGKRKTSVAKVFLKEGTGEVQINNKNLLVYFKNSNTTIGKDNIIEENEIIQSPLTLTNFRNRFDLIIFVRGGGVTSQLEAIRLGIAKCLCECNPESRIKLKQNLLLRRDSRIKERRKYGLKKARKASQYSKR